MIAYEPATCVVCGHADAREIASGGNLLDEVQLLWAYHERRLRPETPPVRLVDRVAFSERPPWRLVACRECGLVYRNPRERVQDLHALYSGETPSERTLQSLHDGQRATAERQARQIRELLGRGGAGLEVGSYVGAFLAAARDSGLAFEGVDINPAVNAFTRRLGVTVHDGDLATVPEDRAYDAIAIWNTFDQLPEPRATLVDAWRRLRPRGVLALRVPNGAFYARMRLDLAHGARPRRAVARALLAQNNLLTFPYRFGFTPSALGRLLADVGFVVEYARGDVLAPIADEWTRGWARLEERMLKAAFGALAHHRLDYAPWFEVYARRPA